MIRYALKCVLDHEFEGWFGSSGDYDEQSARGLVECPTCGSRQVGKQIMAPALAGVKRAEPDPGAAHRLQSMMMEAADRVRAHVESTFDNVGDSFAREARAIHEGRSEERGIYGQATPQEVRALKEDGVPCAPLPPARPDPESLN